MTLSKYNNRANRERILETNPIPNQGNGNGTRSVLFPPTPQQGVATDEARLSRLHDPSGMPGRTPTFPVPGLILLGPGNAILACNTEAVRIVAFPSASAAPKKVHSMILEKLQISHPSMSQGETAVDVREIVSGRRRYLCTKQCLDMHGPERSRTTAVLLDRIGNPEVTMHELCSRFHLTARERQAVGHLVKGMTSKEIAQAMGISTNTVKSFLRLVMTKAGVSTRAGLIGRVAGISMQPTPVQKADSYYFRR